MATAIASWSDVVNSLLRESITHVPTTAVLGSDFVYELATHSADFSIPRIINTSPLTSSSLPHSHSHSPPSLHLTGIHSSPFNNVGHSMSPGRSNIPSGAVTPVVMTESSLSTTHSPIFGPSSVSEEEARHTASIYDSAAYRLTDLRSSCSQSRSFVANVPQAPGSQAFGWNPITGCDSTSPTQRHMIRTRSFSAASNAHLRPPSRNSELPPSDLSPLSCARYVEVPDTRAALDRLAY
ncbi:hypothetical protein JOM56_004985 [Amanita muscaria]